MALTPSNSMEKGVPAPNFELIDTISDKVVSLSDIKGKKGTVIMFICNHCPFVLHINEALVRLANDYQSRGIGFVAISSNDVVNYPQDGPDKMKLHAMNVGYSFPYLYDETQDVAKSYDAACTPDFYIFDKELRCAYRGQLDDSRPGNNVPVTGVDIRHALDAITEDKEFNLQQKPSVGCNIKWK